MAKPMVRIYTGEGNFIDREMNNAELAQHEKDQVAIADIKAREEANAQAKAALLEKLGITADEAKLLLA